MSTLMRPMVRTSTPASSRRPCREVQVWVYSSDGRQVNSLSGQSLIAMGGRVSEPIAGLAVSLDRGSPVPLYFQVATQLEKMIESGEMPVGGRLANEVELADRLGVSRPTMRRAIQYLVERGMLVRKRGVGTQIVHPKVRRPVELSSLYDDLVKTGQSPITEVLDFSVGPATKRMAERYGVPEGLEVTWFDRLRYAGGEPLALMHNAVPTTVLTLNRA